MQRKQVFILLGSNSFRWYFPDGHTDRHNNDGHKVQNLQLMGTYTPDLWYSIFCTGVIYDYINNRVVVIILYLVSIVCSKAGYCQYLGSWNHLGCCIITSPFDFSNPCKIALPSLGYNLTARRKGGRQFQCNVFYYARAYNSLTPSFN